jgi:large subunit ribosomal protein L24
VKLKIKKNDSVLVLSGKDKGKKGKVIRVLPEAAAVVVEAINVIKKHQRPTRNFQGGIIEKPAALSISKVMLVCPRCHLPTRVRVKDLGEKRARVCNRCEEMVDKV